MKLKNPVYLVGSKVLFTHVTHFYFYIQSLMNRSISFVFRKQLDGEILVTTVYSYLRFELILHCNWSTCNVTKLASNIMSTWCFYKRRMTHDSRSRRRTLINISRICGEINTTYWNCYYVAHFLCKSCQYNKSTQVQTSIHTLG